MLGRSEIGQYSCTRLLREMEAAMSESEGEDTVMVEGDEELVRIPEEWIKGSGEVICRIASVYYLNWLISKKGMQARWMIKCQS
jgi:hypothetical protein